MSQSELVRRVSALLPAGTEVVTGHAVTAETQSAIRKTLSFFSIFLMIFAVVAVLVGGFMMFNTFSITVAQRTRENGLLRAIGASKRQILTSVLVEAFAVGLIASVVGIGAGVAVALGLKRLLLAAGIDVPVQGLVVGTNTVVISLLVGVSVTVLSALSPSREAAKVPPIAAMQMGMAGSTGYGSRRRIYIGAGVIAVGVSSLFVGLFSGLSQPVATVAVGALLVFVGVSILGPTVALPLSRWIGAPLTRLRGITGELARDNAMRTAASASVLMIGMGLVCFITIFVASTKASTNNAVDRAFTGDIVLDSGGGLMGGVEHTLALKLGGLPEVAAVSGLRQGLAQVGGSAVVIQAADPSTVFSIMKIDVRQGSTVALDANSIGVYSTVAHDNHWTIGSAVPVSFVGSGVKSLRLAVIYGENAQAGNYFLGSKAYDANFANRLDSKVLVKQRAGVSSAAALAAVTKTAAAYPGVRVLDRGSYKKEQTQPLDQLLALIYALLGLAILIALLGIGNTLALSIAERTHEVGLLRAVGMTRSQLRSVIRWEAVIIALQGTLLGLAIGVFFGWALVRALHDQGITVFHLPTTSLIVIVLLAAVAGAVAAVLPGRRAAKLDVLRAVASN